VELEACLNVEAWWWGGDGAEGVLGSAAVTESVTSGVLASLPFGSSHHAVAAPQLRADVDGMGVMGICVGFSGTTTACESAALKHRPLDGRTTQERSAICIRHGRNRRHICINCDVSCCPMHLPVNDC
jgi:hypothetical protein